MKPAGLQWVGCCILRLSLSLYIIVLILNYFYINFIKMHSAGFEPANQKDTILSRASLTAPQTMLSKMVLFF